MLAYSLNFFYRAAVQKLAVNVHHFPETITDILERAEHPWRLLVSEERTLLDTGGGIKKCEAFLADAPVLLANADVVSDVDIHELLQFHRTGKAAATLVVVPNAHANAVAPITLDSDCNIRDINRTFGKESTGEHLYAGVAVFEPEIFSYLKNEPSSVVYTGYTGLIAAGRRVQAYIHRGRWFDCGTPESYAYANAEVLRESAHWRQVLVPEIEHLRRT